MKFFAVLSIATPLAKAVKVGTVFHELVSDHDAASVPNTVKIWFEVALVLLKVNRSKTDAVAAVFIDDVSNDTIETAVSSCVVDDEAAVAT